jgi:arginyl-tRNA synthetase
LEEFYSRLGIKFDVWDAESKYVAEARRLANDLVKNGMTTTTIDGLKIIQDQKYDGYFIVCKSNNYSSLYLTRFV